MLILKIPKKVIIQKKDDLLIFKSSFGQSKLKLINNLEIKLFDQKLIIKLINNQKNEKKFLNLYHSLIKQKIKGLIQKYKKQLFLKGIGYKILFRNDNLLELKLGFSHSIFVEIPQSVEVTLTKNIILTAVSHDLLILSKFIFLIKNYKRPEPYKGKGFLFKNEKINLKEGKKNKK